VRCPELEQTLGYQLRQALVHSDQVFAEHMGALGITPPLYAILLVIENNPGCLISEVSRLVRITPNNIVQHLDVLLERGLVSRDFSAEDRRAKRLRLTEHGSKYLLELKARHQAVTDLFVSRLGVEGLDRLVQTLKASRGADTD
jgi:DNA-binding MarR family transcriptional regulator